MLMKLPPAVRVTAGTHRGAIYLHALTPAPEPDTQLLLRPTKGNGFATPKQRMTQKDIGCQCWRA